MTETVIQARDQTSFPLSTPTTVVVSVLDVNDNAPVIQQPVPQSISEMVPVNTLVSA